VKLRPLFLGLLFALALGQMAADVAGWTGVRAVFSATCAAPAPKVFSAVRGLETYSTRFRVEWREHDGTHGSLAIDPAAGALLDGPYNRRNVYGAALAYGPVLAADVRTRPMLEGVLRRALCGERALLREMGIDPARVAGGVRVLYEPLRVGALGDLPLVLEAPCP